MERISSIDSIKCMTIFTVVCFHTITFNATEAVNASIWLISFPRVVIPYFFIVSGFLFGEKLKSTLNNVNYFKTYIFNLVKLFIGWYIFYLIYDLVIGILFTLVQGSSIKTELVRYFKSLPNLSVLYYGVGATAYHLWFLTALIWSIVILFIFIRIKKIHFLFITSFILNLVGLFGQTYSGLFHLRIDTRDALFFGLFYVTAGFCISKYFERIKQIMTRVKSKTLCYIFLLVCVLQMLESYITIYLLDGYKGMGYYLSTIPLTIILFILVLKNKNFGKHTLLMRFGKNTFGIYVTHILFISLSYISLHFFDLQDLRNNIIFNLVLTLLIFTLSHYFYLGTQNLRDRLSHLFLKEIPSMIRVILLRLHRMGNKYES